MEDCIYAVSAADENYALPLAVTIRSALDTLAPNRRLHWFLVDGGFEPATRERLKRSCRDPRLTLTWIQPDLQELDDLPVSGHVTRMTYARTLLPTLLPHDLSRVLYLDADLLIRRDLGQLWDEPLAGSACLACVEVACPVFDASEGLPNFDRCGKHLVVVRPIPNCRQLGLPADSPYFNAGVLSIDLEYWRRNYVSRQLLACLHDNSTYLLCWDQYALNVVLVGQWRRLDARWNQGEHLFRYPSASASPLNQAAFDTLRRDPWIVHFTSSTKPWHFENRHPFRRQFFQTLDHTDWQGWRPEQPYHGLMEWVEYRYRRYRQWRKERRQQQKRWIAQTTKRAA